MARSPVVIIAGLIAAVLASYSIGVSLLLNTEFIKDLIGPNPQKLRMDWASAWTLIPGRVYVRNYELDIHNKNDRIQVSADRARLNISIPSLLKKTADIRGGEIEGFSFSITLREKENDDNSSGNVPAPEPPVVSSAQGPEPPGNAEPEPKKSSPPWIVVLENVDAKSVRSLTFIGAELTGTGELKDFGMQIVTKGGPLRIDNLELDMALDAPLVGSHWGVDSVPPRLRTRLRMLENIPKENKGAKLLGFISGEIELVGERDPQSIGLLSRFGDNFNLGVSGVGETNMLAILESGELMPGSRVDYTSDTLEAAYLSYRAVGKGSVTGRVTSDAKEPAKFNILLSDFKLNRQGVSDPYLDGADLSVVLSGQRFSLNEGTEGARLAVDFNDATISDLTDYNLFIPEQANLNVVSGSGRISAKMLVENETASAEMLMAAESVVLDVGNRVISSDIELETRLAGGNFNGDSFDLSGTSFRMSNTRVEQGDQGTEESWWGEITIPEGELLWGQPMDIDARVDISMRDSEPLIALLRDADKQNSLLSRALTVKDLEGTIGIQTSDKKMVLDPIAFKGKGLEIISRLDLIEDAINGTLYVNVRGIGVNFSIDDNKAKLRGIGGRKKVLEQVRPIEN